MNRLFFLQVTYCQLYNVIYSFKTEKDIPDKPFKCSQCGRTIIDYTYHNDSEYEFDGQI